MKPVFKHLLLVSVLLGAGVSAMAGHGSDYAMGEGRTRTHGMAPDKMQAQHAQRAEALKAKLKITPAQEAQWTAFTNAMQAPAGHNPPAIDRVALDKLTTPERLDSMKKLHTERMAQHTAHRDQRDAAIKALYTGLSAEQKKVFDAEFVAMQGRREHKKHH